MKKLFSLFVVAFMAMSMMAATQYCGVLISAADGDANISYKHVSGNTYQVVLEAQGTMTFTRAYNCNFGVNQSAGAGIGLTADMWTVSADGKTAVAEFTTSSEESVPTTLYGNYLCFVKSGGTTARDLVELSGINHADIDWTTTCPAYKDYVFTAYADFTPSVYAFAEGGYTNAEWAAAPAMTEDPNYPGTYTITIADAPATGLNIIFKGNGHQTADIPVAGNAIFNLTDNGTAITATETAAHTMGAVTVKVNATSTPKIHFWNVAGAPAWASDPEMTLVAGYTDWYEYTVEQVDEVIGLNYIIRLGDEQSVDMHTDEDVCLTSAIDNSLEKKVVLTVAECPAPAVPADPHASGKGFGTYQATNIPLYDWDGNFAGENACGSMDLYVVTCGNDLLYKAIINDGTFENGTSYFCQLRPWKEDNTEMREIWALEMSEDKTTRWTKTGGANNAGIGIYGDVMHLTSYQVITGCGARTMQTITYQRDYINNPTLDTQAPVMNSAAVDAANASYVITVNATASDEVFYYFKDVTANKTYISVENTLSILSDASGVAHTVECYAVDYNGNMSAKYEVEVPMAGIEIEAAPQPTHAAADVLAVYSDYYTPAVASTFSKNSWSGITYETKAAESDNYLLYATSAIHWIAWGSTGGADAITANEGFNAEGTVGLDASAMSHVHYDIWSSENCSNVVLTIRDTQIANNVSLVGGQWNSVDIDITTVDADILSNVMWMKFDGINTTNYVAIDNVYFWKDPEPIYFINTGEWENVYCYVRNVATDPDPSAVGVLATKTERQINGYDVYSFVPAADDLVCRFTDGTTANKSNDQDIQLGRYYTYTASWSAEQVEEVMVSTYLLGTINGEDGFTVKADYKLDATLTKSFNLKAGTYKLKVLDHGEWYGYNGTVTPNSRAVSTSAEFSKTVGEDCTLTLSELKKVTFVWDATTSEMSFEFDNVDPTTLTFTIVGDEALIGEGHDWDLDYEAYNMTQNAENSNIFTLSVSNVYLRVGNYEYKAAAEHSWDYYLAPATGNNTLAIDDNGLFDIVYTLSFETGNPVLTAVATFKKYATGCDEVGATKAQKIVRDGKIVIIKNGVEYSVLGARL